VGGPGAAPPRGGSRADRAARAAAAVKRIAFLAGLLGAGVADAEEPFWREVAEPDLRAFDREVDRGLDLLRSAGSLDVAPEGTLPLEQEALARFDRAVAIRPQDPLGHYLRAKALRAIADSPVLASRNREAIAALRRARALDRGRDLEDEIAFDLGIALTIDGDVDGALEEYDRGLSLAVDPTVRSTNLSNSAELLMRLGRLREAIERYEAAIAEVRNDSTFGTFSRALAGYGLAVALDRDDQRGRALEAMRLAWSEDPYHEDDPLDRRTLGNPQAHGVFFVPENDLHYYLGLQLEARAEAETDPATRRSMFEAASNEWQGYLADGGASGPWARQAAAHARAVDRRAMHSPGR
jgi:tetratricopeptide (TPR) repeat protein